MAKVKIFLSDSAGSKVGTVKVNSLNLFDDGNITAPATASRLITVDELNRFDMFQVSSAAATYEIDLPDDAEVGDKVVLFAVGAFELRTETDSVKINNVASKGAPILAAETVSCLKHVSGDWLVTSLTALGAVKTVVATVT